MQRSQETVVGSAYASPTSVARDCNFYRCLVVKEQTAPEEPVSSNRGKSEYDSFTRDSCFLHDSPGLARPSSDFFRVVAHSSPAWRRLYSLFRAQTPPKI